MDRRFSVCNRGTGGRSIPNAKEEEVGAAAEAFPAAPECPMKDLAYYNGRVTGLTEMMIPMNDRAVYFGDGVYDAGYVRNGVCFALGDHVDRFFNSCKLLEMEPGMTKDQLTGLLKDLISKMDREIRDAILYFQMSRGTAPRKHDFPDPPVPPNLLVSITPLTPRPRPDREFRLITKEDTRFAHCNIKTLNLLPNVLASQRAKEAGCDECVLHREGWVTECAHSGLAVLVGGTVVTTPLSQWILPSITRKHLLKLCRELGIPVEERAYSLEELMGADEVMVLSSLALFTRAYEIDGKPVGGHGTELFQKLRKAYLDWFERETGY